MTMMMTTGVNDCVSNETCCFFSFEIVPFIKIFMLSIKNLKQIFQEDLFIIGIPKKFGGWRFSLKNGADKVFNAMAGVN